MNSRCESRNPLWRRAGGMAAALAMVCVLAWPSAARAEAMPKTAADHQTLTQTYHDRAAAFRKEAAEHSAMAREYRQGGKAFDVTGHPQLWALRLAIAHEKMAKEADQMAAAADQLAGYHKKLASMVK